MSPGYGGGIDLESPSNRKNLFGAVLVNENGGRYNLADRLKPVRIRVVASFSRPVAEMRETDESRSSSNRELDAGARVRLIRLADCQPVPASRTPVAKEKGDTP
jgi:hypothetical protein